MKNNFYNNTLKEYARELRTQSVSRAEKYIWKAKLSRNQSGVKFKRQRPIHRFIFDFFAQEIGLIIEIDGSSHWAKSEYDSFRQKTLEDLGYSILRFKEGDVLNSFDEVAMQIEHAIFCLKSKDI